MNDKQTCWFHGAAVTKYYSLGHLTQKRGLLQSGGCKCETTAWAGLPTTGDSRRAAFLTCSRLLLPASHPDSLGAWGHPSDVQLLPMAFPLSVCLCPRSRFL